MYLYISLIIVDSCFSYFYYLVIRDEEEFLSELDIVHVYRGFCETEQLPDSDKLLRGHVYNFFCRKIVFLCIRLSCLRKSTFCVDFCLGYHIIVFLRQLVRAGIAFHFRLRIFVLLVSEFIQGIYRFPESLPDKSPS